MGISNGTSANDYIDGTYCNDTILAGAGNDTVYGNYGDDSIDGGSGNDTLYGGNGDDTVLGGSGDDVLHGDGYVYEETIQGDSARETLLVLEDTIESESSGYDDFVDGGSGNDKIYGDYGNDTLIGGSGTDTIDGGYGSDTLTGGSGADTLTGGCGDDVFDYNSKTESNSGQRDLITDFECGDRIDLTGLGYTGIAAGAAVGSVLGYSIVGGDTIITGLSFSVALSGAHTLDSGDFIFA